MQSEPCYILLTHHRSLSQEGLHPKAPEKMWLEEHINPPLTLILDRGCGAVRKSSGFFKILGRANASLPPKQSFEKSNCATHAEVPPKNMRTGNPCKHIFDFHRVSIFARQSARSFWQAARSNNTLQQPTKTNGTPQLFQRKKNQ